MRKHGIAPASVILLYSYLVLLTAIVLGFSGASVWRVVGMGTLLLILPSLVMTAGPRALPSGQDGRHLLALEGALTLVHAFAFAMACYVVGRAVAWLLV